MSGTFEIFLFVVVQRASVPWLLQFAKVDGAYPFSSNSIVVSVAFAEMLLGLLLACASEMGNGQGPLETIRDVLRPEEIRKWRLLGVSQAAGDMLELYANRFLDASTYQVLLQSKLLVTALLMATVTHRGVTQSSLEWLLLTALSLGLTTYSILSNGSGGFSSIGTALAACKVILSCVNAVFTERILKQSRGIPIVHQIVHMKVYWCFWSVVFMAILEGPSVYRPSQFFRGWGVTVLLVMTTYVVKNWSGTFLLKRLDSLLKNIAEAFAMLVLYLLELCPFAGHQKALELPTFCITMMVVLLVWAYLESKKRGAEQSTGKKISITELLGSPLVYQGPFTPKSMRDGQRLGKKYGLLPSGALTKVPSSCRVVANKNAKDPCPSELLLSTSKKRRCAANPQQEDDVEIGRRCPGDPMLNPSFGLLDTVQELLQQALDSGEEGGWERSVSKALGMCQGLRPYLEAMSSKVSPECEAIATATREANWAELFRAGKTKHLYNSGMMTSMVQGQMLGFFASMLSARRILEIGTFTGFSTLCMAEATRGKVVAIEHDPYLVEFATRHFKKARHGHKIEIIFGDALEVLGSMGAAVDDEGRFELIFIDGDKTQYVQYFQLINDRDLLAPGGLICIDETLWKGSVYSGSSEANVSASSSGAEREDKKVVEAMRELNAAIVGNPSLVSVLLPIRNGLTLVRRLDDHVSADRDHFSGSPRGSPPGAGEKLSSPRGQPGQAQRTLQRRGLPQERGFARPQPAAVTGDRSEALSPKALQPQSQEFSPQCSEESDLPPVSGVAARIQTC